MRLDKITKLSLESVRKFSELLSLPRILLPPPVRIHPVHGSEDTIEVVFGDNRIEIGAIVRESVLQEVLGENPPKRDKWINTQLFNPAATQHTPMTLGWEGHPEGFLGTLTSVGFCHPPEAQPAHEMLATGLRALTMKWPGNRAHVTTRRINNQLCHIVVRNESLPLLNAQLESKQLEFNIVRETLVVVMDDISLNGTYFSMDGVILLKNALKFDFSSWNQAF